MRAIHLCGNPGITKRLVRYLHERARCISDHQIINNIDFTQLPSERARRAAQLSKMDNKQVSELNEDPQAKHDD